MACNASFHNRFKYLLAGLSLGLGALAPATAFAQYDHGTAAGALQTPLQTGTYCSLCHSLLSDAAGDYYGSHDTWSASMMAYAARDPLFLAVASVATQDRPGAQVQCYRCHSPIAHTNGHSATGMLSGMGDTDGVNCDACHRSTIPTTDPMAPYVTNGQLFYSDAPTGMDAVRFGPRADPFMSVRHPAAQSDFIRDSRLCGQCHEQVSPTQHRLSPTGTDLGYALPLQTTYSEWSQSDYARRATPQTCQLCHMAPVTTANPSARVPSAPDRAGMRRHEMSGGHGWGFDLLHAAYPTERVSDLRDARTRAEAFAQNAARVEITTSPTTGRAGERVHVIVRVTNLAGHKLPTGYEDARVMWLQVQVGSQIVSGAMTANELVEDPQARIYRLQMGRMESGRAVPSDFVERHSVVLEDTRIPPLGMRPTDATRPVGRDYALPDGTLRNYDDADFAIDLPGVNGPTPVTVRLLLRQTTRHYVETIAAANHTDTRGTDLMRFFAASGSAPPTEIGHATATITVSGGVDAGPDASTDAAVDATADVVGDRPTTDVPRDVSGDATDGSTNRDATPSDAALDAVATDATLPDSTVVPVNPTPADTGCNCSTTGASSSPRTALSLLSLLGLGLVARRRSARTRR